MPLPPEKSTDTIHNIEDNYESQQDEDREKQRAEP
jgi:hypothetical protein